MRRGEEWSGLEWRRGGDVERKGSGEESRNKKRRREE